ncbi:MAG: MFS transporter [Myxococcaceae bacterium]
MKRRLFSAPSTVIFLLCLMYLITYVDRLNMATAGPLIRKELGLSLTQLGQVFSVFGYPYAVFQIIGGQLGDRFGARRTLTICGLLWAAATLLTGLAGGLVSLFLVRFLLGVGEGATFPTATRAMQYWVAASRRGWAQGVTHAFARAGSAVTPPVVVALMVTVGWRSAFVLLGLASAVWVLVWGLYFRDDPRSHPNVMPEDVAALPTFVPHKQRVSGSTPWALLLRRMAPVTLTYFCYAWTLWLYLYWLPSFFKEGQKLELGRTAFSAFAVFLAGVVGDMLGGALSDTILRRTGNVRLARRSVVLVAYLGCIAALVPVVYLRGLVPVTICLSLGFFFLELAIGPMWAVPMDIAPKFSGTAAGLMNFGSAVASILSPVAFGKIVDLTGNWHLPFWGSVGLLAVGCVSCFFMRPDVPLAEATGLGGSSSGEPAH